MVSVAVATLCLVGCTATVDGAAHGGTIYIDPPLLPPPVGAVVASPDSSGNGCAPLRTASAHGRVSVDADPTAVTAIWLPRLTSAACHTVTTHGDATQGRRLARDIRSAPPFPRGRFACPAALGVGVRLYFAVGSRVEYVEVSLSGCPAISAPGRTLRATTAQLDADLSPLAPPAWQRYVRER